MTTPKWTPEYLPEAVRRYNICAQALAKILPLAAAAVANTPHTTAKVNKATKAKIDAIIATHMPPDAPWLRCYLDTQYVYSLYITTTFHSPSSPHTVAYADLPSSAIAHWDEGDIWTAAATIAPTPLTLDTARAHIQAAIDAEAMAKQAASDAADLKRRAAAFLA